MRTTETNQWKELAADHSRIYGLLDELNNFISPLIITSHLICN